MNSSSLRLFVEDVPRCEWALVGACANTGPTLTDCRDSSLSTVAQWGAQRSLVVNMIHQADQAAHVSGLY